MSNYIENWKLCDYTYCPQIIQHCIDHDISIQQPRDQLIVQLDSFLEPKKAAKLLEVIDENRDAIMACHGIYGNSVFLLLNYGLSRAIIRDYIFEKIELDELLFLSLDEITKALDVSVYTGHKILQSCRFALHVCVSDETEKKKEVLLEDIRDVFRGSDQAYSVESLQQALLWRSGDHLLEECLTHLIDNEEIESTAEKEYINKNIFVDRSLSEVIDSLQDETAKQIVVRRLYGETMEDIGSSLRLPLSRGRVSAIFHNELDHFPPVKEDRYLGLVAKYGMDKETFYELTNALEPTWGYLYERFPQELDQAKIALSGSVLSRLVSKELSVDTKKLQAYMEKHYLNLFDTWISKEDRGELLEMTCKSFDGYFQKSDIEKRFNKILNQYLPQRYEEWKLEDFRVQIVARQGYLVHSPKRGTRYRVISENLVRSIMEEVNIHQYMDTIVSTKKIYEDNIDVMEKYDIRDQYELHSLLRTGNEKYDIHDNQMEVSRMPMLQFGKGQENEIVKQELVNRAPIDVDDFARIMAAKYGYDVGSFISYIRRNFNVYIDENRIEVADATVLESHDYRTLKGILHQDFYFSDDFEELLKQNHLTTKLMDPYVLKRLGYKSYVGYILKDPYSPGKYFERWIMDHTEQIDGRYLEIASFQQALSRLEENMQIFEWERNTYVTLDSLETDRQELEDFIDNILTVLEDGQYFTEYYLAQMSYIDQPLSNTFYKSLFKGNPHIQTTSLGNTWLFKKSNHASNVKDFLLAVVAGNPGMTITGCITYLKRWYNISITRRTLQEKILESGLYYSLDTEKIYPEKPSAYFQQEHLF